MSEAILFRNSSKESEKVNKILKDSKLNYVEVFSLSEKEKPTLIIEHNVYSIKGKDNISEYLHSKKLILESNSK